MAKLNPVFSPSRQIPVMPFLREGVKVADSKGTTRGFLKEFRFQLEIFQLKSKLLWETPLHAPMSTSGCTSLTPWFAGRLTTGNTIRVSLLR
jgi:hypothetical protein